MTEEHINGHSHDRTALILYGSETGNSQDAAEQLGRIAERLRFVTRVVDMDSVEINELLNYKFVIFTISTTGQGDIPANARKFWKSLLRKRLPPDCLSKLRFTTFGLGDSSYVKFNWAARKLHKRLEQLGAQELYPRGEGDEQHSEGVDGAFLPWSLDFKVHLLEKFPLPDGSIPIPDTELLPPKLTLELVENLPRRESKEDKLLNSQSQTQDRTSMDKPVFHDPCVQEPVPDGELKPQDTTLPPPDLLPIPGSWTATLDRNFRMTPEDHWQDVRHISLLVQNEVTYRPGDIVTIYPKNFPEDVESLIQLQDWGAVADKPITYKASTTVLMTDSSFIPAVSGLHTTNPPTLRSLLLHNLDITAIPRRFFFEMIAKFADDPLHRERLLEFTNPALSDEFFDYATRPRRSILEVLHDFPSVHIPWSYVPSLFPPIRGRQFSIASGGHLKRSFAGSTRIDICVALVKYRTVLKKIRQGLCSRYLDSLASGTKIAITMKRGSFNFTPSQAQRPILMIAPGTGVAPMRSLIWERACWLAKEQLSLPSAGSAYLLFGGRNKSKDFLFGDEWAMKALHVNMLTAFSRDQKEKIYVQDVIRREKAVIFEMLSQKATVFVCGSSGKMPVAVRAALVDVLFEEGTRRMVPGASRETAEDVLKAMEKEGRYVQETW